jgi:hypothetical protein
MIMKTLTPESGAKVFMIMKPSAAPEAKRRA